MAERLLKVIAREINEDWLNLSPYARPYLLAMFDLNTMSDNYYADSASSVVAYFLSNAGQWRGPEARRIKAELNAMLKAQGKSQ